MFSDKDYFGDPSWPQEISAQKTDCLINSSTIDVKLDLSYLPSSKHRQKESDQYPSSYEEEMHENDVHMFLNQHKVEYSTLKYAEITYLDDFKRAPLFQIEESEKQVEEKIVSQEANDHFNDSPAKFEESYWVEDSNYQLTPNKQNYLALGEFFRNHSSSLQVLHSNKPSNFLKSKYQHSKQNRQKSDQYFKQTQLIQNFLNENHHMSVSEKQEVMQEIDKRLQKKLIEPIQGDKDDSEEYFQSNQLQAKISRKSSAKYKILTKIQKQYLVYLATESTTTDVAKKFNISVNNICRWKKGCERKAGAGRRITNQQLQQKVIDFVKNQVNAGKTLTKKQVQMKAKEYSQNKNFKASKGWFERFMNRNIKIFTGQNLKQDKK